MSVKTRERDAPASSVEGPAPRSAISRSTDPLYLQVAGRLKGEIVGGTYPVGSHLPTESELGALFSVSRHTVREALRRLREEGLTASRQGAGTVVVPPRSEDSQVLHAMSINDLVAFAAETRFRIDSTRMIAMDGKLASRIGVPGGDKWLAVRGFRYAVGSGAPVCWSEYYINRDYAAVARLLQRHEGPIFSLIEDMFAIGIAEVQQEISAVTVPAAIAGGLKAKPRSVALEVRRTYRLDCGKVVQLTVNTHPATRFRQSMTMRRVGR